MNATEKPANPSPFESSPAQDYFRAIEDAFIAWRGTPFQLSPDDHQTSKVWFKAGIPLELVLAVLERAVEKRVENAQDVKRRLRYYDPAVQEAWRERRKLLAPQAEAPAPRLDVEVRLERLRAALRACGPFQALADRLVTLAGPADAVEEALERLDEDLLVAAEAALDPAEHAALADDLERALTGLRARLPAATVEESRVGLKKQLLRRAFRLPVLSLFDPVAEDS
jgi:hypothetical protein